MRKIELFEKYANKYDDWYKTDFGKYASELEDKLMLELLRPEPGQTLLDVGCGTGRHLLLFENLGLRTTGIDASSSMLVKAKEKVNENSLTLLSDTTDLPFKNKSFDLSIIFLVLEFSENPLKLLKEAVRVTKGKIFIGFLNRYSLLALQRRIKGVFKNSVYRKARFYSFYQLQKILRKSFEFKSLTWEGAIFLPWLRFKPWQWLDLKPSFVKNPFCAFIGVLIEL